MAEIKRSFNDEKLVPHRRQVMYSTALGLECTKDGLPQAGGHYLLLNQARLCDWYDARPH